MNEMTTLANIERRIGYHMQSAYSNILEVGRCLIEAKESGLVPHGQWEAWVNRVAGMNDRSAQRLMQAAREVSPDSAMAKLPISKIQAILALPEPQREAVAEKAVEENQTLRELQATIDAMRGDLEKSRATVQRVERERDSAITVLDKAQKRRAEFEHECNDLRRQLQGVKETAASSISKKAQAKIDKLTKELDEARKAVEEVLEKSVPFTGISEEAQAKIDALTAQLADAEQMAEHQAREREKAQAELLDLRTQAARGEGPVQDDLTAEAVGMAARTFMGCVGYVPHSDKLLTLREKDRADIASYAVTLQRWAEDVLRAVNRAKAAVIIEEV